MVDLNLLGRPAALLRADGTLNTLAVAAAAAAAAAAPAVSEDKAGAGLLRKNDDMS